jgi:hypothetical protein
MGHMGHKFRITFFSSREKKEQKPKAVEAVRGRSFFLLIVVF